MLAEETLLNSQSNRALACHRGGSAPRLHSASQPAQPLESVWAAGTANPSASFQLCSRLPWRGGWEDQINPSRAPRWAPAMSHTPSQTLPTFLVVGGCQKEVLLQFKKKNKQKNPNKLNNQTTNKNSTKHFRVAALPFSCHKTIWHVLHSASAIRNCSL